MEVDEDDDDDDEDEEVDVDDDMDVDEDAGNFDSQVASLSVVVIGVDAMGLSAAAPTAVIAVASDAVVLSQEIARG